MTAGDLHELRKRRGEAVVRLAQSSSVSVGDLGDTTPIQLRGNENVLQVSGRELAWITAAGVQVQSESIRRVDVDSSKRAVTAYGAPERLVVPYSPRYYLRSDSTPLRVVVEYVPWPATELPQVIELQ